MKIYVRATDRNNTSKETVLKFNYPSTNSVDAQRLCEVLDQNNVEYVCYDREGTSGWPIEFHVLRSGKTWDEIMGLVNSVSPARYKREKEYVSRENGTISIHEFL